MGTNVNLFITTLLIYILLTLALTQSAPEGALIKQLPGLNVNLPSKHYSGYVPISEINGKKLFYYFVVSERNPSEDPVVLFLEGGYGCSGMAAFVHQHGPVSFEKVKPRGSMPKLHLNEYSWSKVSNIIYLDSPAGAGYSYSGNESDYSTGDKQTASDTHIFLLEWFKLYPEFLRNPFYIAGESYGGVYTPTLASELVKGIDANVKPKINFKGYMVGNGKTNTEIDDNSVMSFAHGMGLISDDLYQELVAECNGTYFDTVKATCKSKVDKALLVLEDVNELNILEPCNRGPEDKITISTALLPESFRELGITKRPIPVRKRMLGRTLPLRSRVRDGIIRTWPQLLQRDKIKCKPDDEVATTWLNNEAVREALHAENESVAGKWMICTELDYVSDSGSMIRYHKQLTSLGLRALIYSGDHDMLVPFTGTQAWTRSIGYKIVDEWRAWYVDDHQVAGYIQGYDNDFTFLTIKGAGHTAPRDKPKEALQFYSRWLEAKRI
ncbi:Carboxypeptidase [Heracleum sosnowskyi]|uniref:Carboxypeptidase n=1 Tax=Heracleum sosnowskyi TaxID=360622 RepID=A0AAD8J7Q6_9APIA|nr:Carboxypeptidase [Heracleum sosnowskyi]